MTQNHRLDTRWSVALLFAALVAGAAIPIAGQSASPGAKRAFETRDWYKVKTVGSPAMSPDGKYVAVQVTSVIEAKNTRINEIWVVDTASGGGEPMRFSAPGFDSTNPRFSADGNAPHLHVHAAWLHGHVAGPCAWIDPAASSNTPARRPKRRRGCGRR